MIAAIFIRSTNGQPIEEPKLIMEEVTDPAVNARARAQHERAERNADWLQHQWPNLLPQALGKFVAFAGQEAFIADTALEARALARKAHPEDDGVLVQYVRPDRGPRIYTYRG
jgi:hypothetical protein